MLANAVLKLAAEGQVPEVATLIARLELEATSKDIEVKAGAEEALARLKQAAARGAEEGSSFSPWGSRWQR